MLNDIFESKKDIKVQMGAMDVTKKSLKHKQQQICSIPNIIKSLFSYDIMLYFRKMERIYVYFGQLHGPFI